VDKVKTKRDRGWCSFHEKRRIGRVVDRGRKRLEAHDCILVEKVTCFTKR